MGAKRAQVHPYPNRSPLHPDGQKGQMANIRFNGAT
jgi:hypothetical protein